MLTNLNFTGLKVEVAKDTNRHVRKTLPPSLSGFPGEADIKYFVKATIIRPQFYKENIRAVSAVLDQLLSFTNLPDRSSKFPTH
jgi:hypothetical protein